MGRQRLKRLGVSEMERVQTRGDKMLPVAGHEGGGGGQDDLLKLEVSVVVLGQWDGYSHQLY